MKTKSAKAKARRLQDAVVDALRIFFRLTPEDVRPAIMGEGGSDVKLSERGRRYMPYAVECKNTEALRVWEAIKQGEAHAKKEGLPGSIVVFKKNGSKIYVIQELEPWLEWGGRDADEGVL